MSKLNPQKLKVNFMPGVTPTKPIIPRCYTLTHSDTTAELYLSIGLKYDYDKINPSRDEVLGEWINTMNRYIFYSYLHVDGKLGLSETAMRYKIFKRELPLALEAIRYGDKTFFITHPDLDNAPIAVYFNSKYTHYNTLEPYGTFSDYTI